MDVLGRRALRPLTDKLGLGHDSPQAQGLALAGDLISNSIYYAAVGWGRPQTVWQRGAALGAAAGLGAITLPQLMGLGHRPQARTWETRMMAFSWYFIGGLAAAGAWQVWKKRS